MRVNNSSIAKKRRRLFVGTCPLVPAICASLLHLCPSPSAAADLLVSNWFGGVSLFDGTTGAFKGEIASESDNTEGILVGADGRIYCADALNDVIRRFDGQDGDYLGTFASGGGLNGPHGIAFGPDGYLYVADYWNNRGPKHRSTGSSR